MSSQARKEKSNNTGNFPFGTLLFFHCFIIFNTFFNKQIQTSTKNVFFFETFKLNMLDDEISNDVNTKM